MATVELTVPDSDITLSVSTPSVVLTTGTRGPKGDKGDKGDTGDTGPAGPTGATGATGATGPAGPAGADGADGADGQGVPAGGTTGQILTKIDATDHNTQWTDTTSINLKTTGTLSVGTTTNPYQLTVRKDQAAPTQFGVGNYTSGGSSGFRLDAFGSYYVINLLYGTGAYYLYTNATMIFGTYAARDVIFYSNTTDRGRIHSTGEWSIGTATKSAMLSVNGAVRVGQYTVATVPSASAMGAGSTIYVSDEVGGACLAFSDGTNWKRAHDPLTTIS